MGRDRGPNDLEEQWLDALADHHGCLGDMNRAVAADINTPRNTCKKAFLGKLLNISEEELRWQIYTCIRAGRIVHNRPHGIGADPAGKFYPGHDIHFAALEPWNSCRFVTGCLGNEAALTSFERRSQIGMKPIWGYFGTQVEQRHQIYLYPTHGADGRFQAKWWWGHVYASEACNTPPFGCTNL